MSLQLNGDTGVQFNDASLQGAAASPYVLKNKLINGSMQIDQRNAGAATANTINGYTLDRWAVFQTTTGKLIAQQNQGSASLPSGFYNYLGATSQSAYTVSASDKFLVAQAFEGYNMADLGWGTANAQTVTLSFRVYSSLTGTFGGAIQNYGATRSYPFTYTISSANTWTTISVTIPGDTSSTWTASSASSTTNAGWGYLFFGLGVGSTYSGTAGAWASANYASATGATSVVGTNGATWYVTGVQLEIGTSATPFERRLYGQELMNCQRYYARLVSTSGNYAGFGAGYYYNATTAAIYVKYPVTMRAAPTASISNVRADSASGTSATTLSTVYYGSDAAYLNIAGGSSVPVSSGSVLIGNNNANAYVDFSAEL